MKQEQPPPHKFQLLIAPDLLKRIDSWRFRNSIATRASAMRALIEDALKAKGPAGASTPPSHDHIHPVEGNENEQH